MVLGTPVSSVDVRILGFRCRASFESSSFRALTQGLVQIAPLTDPLLFIDYTSRFDQSKEEKPLLLPTPDYCCSGRRSYQPVYHVFFSSLMTFHHLVLVEVWGSVRGCPMVDVWLEPCALPPLDDHPEIQEISQDLEDFVRSAILISRTRCCSSSFLFATPGYFIILSCCLRDSSTKNRSKNKRRIRVSSTKKS